MATQGMGMATQGMSTQGCLVSASCGDGDVASCGGDDVASCGDDGGIVHFAGRGMMTCDRAFRRGR